MNKLMNEKIVNKLIKNILYVGILNIIIVLFITLGYTYLCEDDYSFAGGAYDGLQTYGNSFISSLHLAWRYYNTNQGTFLFNFLIHFINPYERWGLPGFHTYMICIAVLFIYSVYYLIKCVIKDELIQLVYLFGMLIVTFCTCFSEGVRELFLWYTGTLNFTLEFSLSLITVGIMIKYFNGEVKAWNLVLASITGFLASGGALIVTAAHCSWCLIIMIMAGKKFLEDKKVIIPFIFSLLGAFINALAPGNFARSNEWATEGHSGVGDALRDTFICLSSEIKVLFGSKLLVIVLVIVFILAIYVKDIVENAKVSVKRMILSWISVFVVQYVSIFPVVLGNHESALSAMRTREAFYIISFIMYIFSLTMTGIYIRKYSTRVRYIITSIAVLVVMCLCFISGKNHSDINTGYTFCATRDIASGNLKKNYDVRSYILNSLEVADVDSDVILFLPYFECKSTYGMGINEDPNSFVNNNIRNWKRIRSLTVYYWGYTWPPAEE